MSGNSSTLGTTLHIVMPPASDTRPLTAARLRLRFARGESARHSPFRHGGRPVMIRRPPVWNTGTLPVELRPLVRTAVHGDSPLPLIASPNMSFAPQPVPVRGTRNNLARTAIVHPACLGHRSGYAAAGIAVGSGAMPSVFVHSGNARRAAMHTHHRCRRITSLGRRLRVNRRPRWNPQRLRTLLVDSFDR